MRIPPGVALTESRLVPLRKEADPYLAVAQAGQLARAMGFDSYATTEIETAVSELATNVLQHGVEGVAWLRCQGTRFEVTCLDRGPGFRATAGRPPAGLGVGLAGAQRLMDGLVAEDRSGDGARVTAWRELPRARERAPSPSEGPGAGLFGTPAPLQVAVAIRAADGESACGDGYALLRTGHGVVVAVVDGVGHGPAAAEATAVALEALTERAAGAPLVSLLELLEATHQASSRQGRGAVAGLARLAPSGITWAGVGNVRVHGLGRMFEASEEGTPAGGWSGYRMGFPGCLGVRWPEPAPQEEPLPEGPGVLLATDGVPVEAVEAVLPGRSEAGVSERVYPSGAAGGPATSDLPAASLRRLAEAVLCRAESGDDGLVLVAAGDLRG